MESKKIAMIGAGRLATNLARALSEAGHSVVEVYSRTMEKAMKVAAPLSAKAVDELDSVTREADIYILAVKDDALGQVAETLCPSRRHALFVHTAGSIPMALFEGLAGRYGVLYPMQTFSSERRADFSKITCFIEGNDEQTTLLIEQLAQSVSPSVVRLSSADRRYLHLAAVFACNFTNHCYALAAKVAAKGGIPFSTILPLIDETAEKVHELLPREAQTGPAVRYDEKVMAAHMDLMADDPLTRDIYELMSKSIHNNL